MITLWSTTKALIGAGLRFCHPYTINQLFQSIIIPCLSYGLEICDLTVTNIIDLNINTRSALKSLFNISKHGCNILLPALDIEEFNEVLIRHKINLFTRLFNNATTRAIILNELSAIQSTSSFIKDIQYICASNQITIYELLHTKRMPKTVKRRPPIEIDQINRLELSFELWRLPEQREIFRTLLEMHIPQNTN